MQQQKINTSTNHERFCESVHVVRGGVKIMSKVITHMHRSSSMHDAVITIIIGNQMIKIIFFSCDHQIKFMNVHHADSDRLKTLMN